MSHATAPAGSAQAHASHSDEFNPFLSMAQLFDTAADHLGLEKGLRDVLRTPDREMTVAIPVVMDDGRIEVFTGYRVQHNFSRGPCKGGIRYAPEPHRALPRTSHEDRLLRLLVGSFALVILAATAYFRWAEHLSWLDALYFVVVTTATVGYGDISLLHSSALHTRTHMAHTHTAGVPPWRSWRSRAFRPPERNSHKLSPQESF